VQPREKAIAIERVRADQTGIENKTFNKSQMIEAFKDPKTWLMCLFHLTISIPNGGLTNFAPLVVKGLGYTSQRSTLLMMPTGVIQTVASYLCNGGVFICLKYLPSHQTRVVWIFLGILVGLVSTIFLRALALIVYGPYPLRPPSFWPGVAVAGGLVMAWDRVFAGGAGIAMLLALVWFMNRTPWGEALNAVSQSRESAAIVGINAQRFYMLAFGLGGALAGGAGALVGPIYSLSPSMGLLPDTQAFAIVILGGMGSVTGSILAGLMIGVSESMFVALFPDPSRSLTYAQAFSLLILMLVLLIRPTGLFGRAHVAME